MSLTAQQPIEYQSFPAVTLEQLKAYAEASGDFNPIHQDEAVAKKMGLPGVIAHGMLSSGIIAERALRFMLEEQGIKTARLVKYKNRFKSMVFLGDVISVGGTVKSVTHDEVVLDLQAKNQKGEVATTGEARFRV